MLGALYWASPAAGFWPAATAVDRVGGVLLLCALGLLVYLASLALLRVRIGDFRLAPIDA